MRHFSFQLILVTIEVKIKSILRHKDQQIQSTRSYIGIDTVEEKRISYMWIDRISQYCSGEVDGRMGRNQVQMSRSNYRRSVLA